MFLPVVLVVAALEVTASQSTLLDRPVRQRAATLLAQWDDIRSLDRRELEAKLVELRATPVPDGGVGLGLIIGGAVGIATGIALFAAGLSTLGSLALGGMPMASFGVLLLVGAIVGVAGIAVLIAGLVTRAAARREARALENEIKAVERQLSAPASSLRLEPGFVLATFG